MNYSVVLKTQFNINSLQPESLINAVFIVFRAITCLSRNRDRNKSKTNSSSPGATSLNKPRTGFQSFSLPTAALAPLPPSPGICQKNKQNCKFYRRERLCTNCFQVLALSCLSPYRISGQGCRSRRLHLDVGLRIRFSTGSTADSADSPCFVLRAPFSTTK